MLIVVGIWGPWISPFHSLTSDTKFPLVGAWWRKDFWSPFPPSKQMVHIGSFPHLNMIHTQLINWKLKKMTVFYFHMLFGNPTSNFGQLQVDCVTHPIRFHPFLSIFDLQIMGSLIRKPLLWSPTCSHRALIPASFLPTTNTTKGPLPSSLLL